MEKSKEYSSKKCITASIYVKLNNCTYMDAVIHFLEEYSFDFSMSSKLLSQPIIEKIEGEAKDLNLLPKNKNKLPFA